MEFREQWKVAYKVKQNLDDISDAMVSTQGLREAPPRLASPLFGHCP